MQRPFVSEILYVEGADLTPVAGVLTVTDEIHAVNTDGTPGYTTITTITKATPRVGQKLRLHRGPLAITPILFQPITGNMRSQTEQGVWIAQAGDEVELVCTAVIPAVLWTVARVTSLTIAPVDAAIVGGAAAVGLSSRVGLVPETNPDDLDTLNGGVAGQVVTLQLSAGAPTPVRITQAGNIRCPYAQDLWLSNASDYVRLLFDTATGWSVLDYKTASEFQSTVNFGTPGVGTGTLDAQDGRLQIASGPAGAQFLFNILNGVEGEELFVRFAAPVTSITVEQGGNITLPLGRNVVLDNVTDMLRFQYHGATWALMEVLKAVDAPVAETVGVPVANAIPYRAGGSIRVTFGGAPLNVVTGSADGAKLRLTFADAGTIAVTGAAGSIVTPDGLPLRVRAGDEVELFYNAATTFWTLTAYLIALPTSVPVGTLAALAAPSSGRQFYVAFQRLAVGGGGPFAALTGLQADIPIYGALPVGAEVLDIVVDNVVRFLGAAPPAGLATLNCQVGQVGALAGVRAAVDVAAATPAVPRRLHGVRGAGLDFAAGQVPNAHFTAVATGTAFLNLSQMTAGQVDFYVLFMVLPRVP